MSEVHSDPCNLNLHDDAFTVYPRKGGVYTSYDTKGKAIVTSLTEQSCINTTRFVLKNQQDAGLFPPLFAYTDSSLETPLLPENE